MKEDNIIIVKLDALKELFEQRFDTNEAQHKVVNKHLEKLNGQTQKNTEFRLKAGVLIAIGGVVLPILVSAGMNLL